MNMTNDYDDVNLQDFQIDKETDEVMYNDEQHLYITKKDKQKCISVTTLIHEYCQPFDAEFWSCTKALEELVGVEEFKATKAKLQIGKKFDIKLVSKFKIELTDFLNKKEEILLAWKTKNTVACERGTKLHRVRELAILGGDAKELRQFNLGGKFECVTDNKLKVGDKGIYPELLLSRISEDGVLRIAGQADLVIIDGTSLYIGDFKTNKKIDKTSYFDVNTKRKQTMRYPLNNIQDCNFYHYTLQLSLYAWMAQKINPALEVKGLMLIHIDHSNKETLYELEYLKDDVERMLTHYKKQLLIEKQNEKHKPIVY